MQKKLYKVRFDTEDAEGYSENFDSLNLVAENIEEVILEAKKRLSGAVIGEITLIAVID